MPLEFDASPEDLRVFLDEADELLQVLETNIVQLEQSPDAADLIQAIFRAAHTLKGSSATLGHRKMAELTHAMENVLDRLRQGQMQPSTELVSALFACIDRLQRFRDEIAAGEDLSVDSTDVLTRLARFEKGAGGAGSANGAGSADGAGAAAERDGLSAADWDRVEEGLRHGRQAWDLRTRIAATAAMPAVRAFQVLMAVRELGEAVHSWPEQQALEENWVGEECRIVFLSQHDAAAVRACLERVPDVTIASLDPLTLGSTSPRPTAGAGSGSQLTPADAPGAAVRQLSRTVRVDVELLDNLMNQAGELIIDRTRLNQIVSQVEALQEDQEWVRELQAAITHIGRVTMELQEEVMRARMFPVENLFKKFPRLIRDVALRAQKEIRFEMRGEETELDRSVIEEIGDPLMHLLRNSVDHGIEPPLERVRQGKPSHGTIVLEASHEENQIVISVRDDGRGIVADRIRQAAVRKGLLTEEAARRISDAEARSLIFTPGFSTADQVSDISGRGVGLDVVQKNIERLSGSVEVFSEPGRGTEFRIRLPLTLAIIRALLVEHLNTTLAVPLHAVSETIRLSAADIRSVGQREVTINRGAVVPLVRLEQAFNQEPPTAPSSAEAFAVIVNVFGKPVGLVVDGLVGEGDLVIKSLGKYVGDIRGIAGATILGDGNVALILDVVGLVAHAGRQERTA